MRNIESMKMGMMWRCGDGMSGDGEPVERSEEKQEYLEKEKLITEAVNRCMEKWKGFIENKFKTYYYTGEELHRLWTTGRWKSRMQLYNTFYASIPDRVYRDEFTPKILWHCHRFYEYVEDAEELWNNFRKLFFLVMEKEDGKVSQSGKFTITGYLEGEVKNIEEEVMEIFDTIRKVYPDWMVIEPESIAESLEPVKNLLKKSLKNALSYRILWEMYHENVPSYRLIEAVKIGSAYRDKKTLETLRREYSRLGARKPRRLPPLFCHLCGAQLDWDDKNIVWIHVPVELRCLKEYLIKASTGDINMTIEDEGILEELCMELIRKYNIEEIGEEE